MAEETTSKSPEESPPDLPDEPTALETASTEEPKKEPAPTEPNVSAVLQKQVDELKAENESIKQHNKEDAAKLLQSVLAPRAAPSEPIKEPTEEDYLTDPKKSAETLLAALYEKKIAPREANTSTRLFGIDYQLVAGGSDKAAFAKLKPEIDKYFQENPDAINVPNALQTVFTHFKGIHFDRLHKELVEEASTAEETSPPSPTPPSSKPKASALSAEEKHFARSIGLTEDQMLESKKEVLG